MGTPCKNRNGQRGALNRGVTVPCDRPPRRVTEAHVVHHEMRVQRRPRLRPEGFSYNLNGLCHRGLTLRLVVPSCCQTAKLSDRQTRVSSEVPVAA